MKISVILEYGIKLGLTMVNTFGVLVIVVKTVMTAIPVLDGNLVTKAAVILAMIGLSMVVSEKVNDKWIEIIDDIFERRERS